MGGGGLTAYDKITRPAKKKGKKLTKAEKDLIVAMDEVEHMRLHAREWAEKSLGQLRTNTVLIQKLEQQQEREKALNENLHHFSNAFVATIFEDVIIEAVTTLLHNGSTITTKMLVEGQPMIKHLLRNNGFMKRVGKSLEQALFAPKKIKEAEERYISARHQEMLDARSQAIRELRKA